MMISGSDHRRFVLFLSVFLFLVLIFSGCRRKTVDPSYEFFQGRTMGTTYQIKVRWSGNGRNKSPRRGPVDEILAEVNHQMSLFDPESEISRFNRFGGTDWFSVSPETARVVHTALRISRQSRGAFDVTAAPLVELWGFGKGPVPQKLPTEKDIEKIREKVGFSKLSVSLDPPALKKTIPGLTCNLSAIAKGYGVDRLSRWLEENGANDYMVEIGGEVRCRGVNPNGKPWRIGIVTPDSYHRLSRVVDLTGMSMATSGDYRNFYRKEGRRYSHTINPRSGRPVTHLLASVTVLHKQCTLADGYATAINVLGPKEGMDLAEGEDLAVMMILRRREGGFGYRYSSGFPIREEGDD